MQLPAERVAGKGWGLSAEPVTDEEAARRVLDGDAAAFELIMRRYNQRLFRVARSIVGEDAAAEDVVQESYLKAYKHLDQFAGLARFSTWLTRIAVYEASARRRWQHRVRLLPDEDLEQGATGNEGKGRDASDAASQRELGLVLAAAIEALPEELRVVVSLRMIENLSTAETAECLELSEGNVKTRLHRARRALREGIDARIGEEARRLYAFDGERCDRIVESVLRRIGTEAR